MPAVRVDVAAIVGLGGGRAARYLFTLGTIVQNEWKRMAQTALADVSPGSRQAYTGSIRIVGPTGSSVRVEMRDLLGNIFEQGLGPNGVGSEGPFDLRKFLLKPGTRNVRRGKGGSLYLSVPFRKSMAQIGALALGWRGGTHNKGGIDAGSHHITIRGHESRASTILDAGQRKTVREIMKDVRGLSARKTERSPEGNKIIERGTRLPPGRAPKLASHHATDPLAGLQRDTKQATAGGPAGGQYVNFRTISNGPNGKPWMHPGIRARRIADQVKALIPMIMARSRF